MTEPRLRTSEVELTEPWADPIYRADLEVIAPRPSAPRSPPAGAMSPPHGLQAFSAVPLPSSPRFVEAPSTAGDVAGKAGNPRLLVAGALALAAMIGLAVKLALSPAAMAPTQAAPSPIEATKAADAKHRAPIETKPAPGRIAAGQRTQRQTKAAGSRAPKKEAQAAKPIKQQAPAPKSQAPAAGAKPATAQRASRYADEPFDP